MLEDAPVLEGRPVLGLAPVAAAVPVAGTARPVLGLGPVAAKTLWMPGPSARPWLLKAICPPNPPPEFLPGWQKDGGVNGWGVSVTTSSQVGYRCNHQLQHSRL